MVWDLTVTNTRTEPSDTWAIAFQLPKGAPHEGPPHLGIRTVHETPHLQNLQPV